MPTISRYVVSPTPDTWGEALSEYDDYTEARDAAAEQGACVTEITYEFSDTELVDDFRETDDPDTDDGDDEPEGAVVVSDLSTTTSDEE